MIDKSTNNKRIAKNTILLYFRMLLLLVVSLYTSRVILKSLGIEDYGIYNVVGGVIAMFSLLSNSLTSAITRFLNVELGKGNEIRLKNIFCTSINIQAILGFIIIVIAETLGLWFLNEKMVIPENRILAANWVFQFSIFTFFINLISVPYNALIVAHEKMSAFAYISVFEGILKLAIAFLILYNPFDRLIYYALLLAILSICIRILYSTYCKRNFKECTFHFIWDVSILKEMFGFAGWNLIGTSAAVLRDQGGNIIINLFTGPTVNAARGIAMQVNTAVNGFISNFQTALNPQIMKSYASDNRDYLFQLVFQGTRLCFFILLVLALPIIINAPYILHIWLGKYPEHTVYFVQLILLYSLSESLSGPLVTTMLATGRIRNYQLLVGGIQMLNLPVAYVCLKLGMPPETVTVVAIILSVCCEAARLLMLRKMIGLPIKKFLSQVYFNVILVSIISAIFPLWHRAYVDINSIDMFIINLLICICSITLSILYIGCNKDERYMIYSKFVLYTKKISKK